MTEECSFRASSWCWETGRPSTRATALSQEHSFLSSQNNAHVLNSRLLRPLLLLLSLLLLLLLLLLLILSATEVEVDLKTDRVISWGDG